MMIEISFTMYDRMVFPKFDEVDEKVIQSKKKHYSCTSTHTKCSGAFRHVLTPWQIRPPNVQK